MHVHHFGQLDEGLTQPARYSAGDQSDLSPRALLRSRPCWARARGLELEGLLCGQVGRFNFSLRDHAFVFRGACFRLVSVV
jgi:hypothetical protein